MITKRIVDKDGDEDGDEDGCDENGDGDGCDEVMRLLAKGVRSNLCSSHAFSLSEFLFLLCRQSI